MRARYPDAEGFVERDGVKIAYEVFGSGGLSLVFVPIDPLVHWRAWKAQVPYLAREYRVITVDPRGNGRSDRPRSGAAYADTELVADTIAVMDAAGVDRAVLAGICASSWTALMTAAWHPDRCLGVVTIGTWAPFLTPPTAGRAAYDFDQVLDTEEGWAKVNRHYMLRDWPGHLEFFFGEMFPEPHSSKQREDCVGWAMETKAATNLLFVDAPFSSASQAETEAALARVRCPVLTIHGRLDRCQPWRRAARRTRLPARRAGLPGHSGRLRRRHEPAPPCGRGVPGGQGAGPQLADGRGDRAADRPGPAYLAACGRRPRGARLRARPAPAPGRLRPGRGAGRADHHDGAHR